MQNPVSVNRRSDYSDYSVQVIVLLLGPWAKNDDGGFFKAALLSGAPGIGKTTTVQVVCKELGFDLVEFNASDTRSKKLLKAEVSELLSNTSLKDYFTGIHIQWRAKVFGHPLKIA